MRVADACAVLVGLTLPWSTTASAIATVLWIASLLPGLDRAAFVTTLRHPASITAIVLVTLGALGMLWADVPWAARLAALERFSKLLAIPLLLYHFRKSDRGIWVFAAFLASCTAVLALSWVQFIAPQLARAPHQVGVPVKNYIVQGQEFTLCIFVLAFAVLKFLRQRRLVLAGVIAALASAFVLNMLFVVSSRTALVVLVVLFFVFCLKFLRGRLLAAVLLIVAVAGVLTWTTSPYLRLRATAVFNDLALSRHDGLITSAAQRLEYWRKSLQFVAAAPVAGHGTGSIRSLFERDAAGKTGVAAEVIGNPHNQALAVAVQLGLIGVVALLAMWIVHLRMFLGAGLAAWTGLAAVVQNFTSSLVNSHLFDSAEGWIYVLAIGVAGGMVLKAQHLPADRLA